VRRPVPDPLPRLRSFRPRYVGHRGWPGIYLDVPVDWQALEGILVEAYRWVAPRRLRAGLEGGEGG